MHSLAHSLTHSHFRMQVVQSKQVNVYVNVLHCAMHERSATHKYLSKCIACRCNYSMAYIICIYTHAWKKKKRTSHIPEVYKFKGFIVTIVVYTRHSSFLIHGHNVNWPISMMRAITRVFLLPIYSICFEFVYLCWRFCFFLSGDFER